MNILVTGGAGFIGSHTVIELCNAGHTPIIVDNYSNSRPDAIRRIEKITGQQIQTYEIDLTSKTALQTVFETHSFDVVMHFAGFKSIGESVAKPISYYQNNLISTLNVLELMDAFGVREIVFSSSAVVYGNPVTVPVIESESLKPTNPYGSTKAMIEYIIQDWVTQKDNKVRNSTILRYFNPIGAHPSGLLGELPNGAPNNLFPYIAQVAGGVRKTLSIFGRDYDTNDGTGVRDYIHIVDLARAHVSALSRHQKSMYEVINVGTGTGCSVLEAIAAFERASDKKIPYTFTERRSGDLATVIADNSHGLAILDNWKPLYTIDQACMHAWHWQQQLTKIEEK